MTRTGIKPCPDSVRAAKLLRYLLDSHSVNILGNTYRITEDPEDIHEDVISVNDLPLVDFRDLAGCLDGLEFARVMNYKEKTDETGI
jgi:hypothetical protein